MIVILACKTKRDQEIVKNRYKDHEIKEEEIRLASGLKLVRYEIEEKREQPISKTSAS